MILHIRPSQQKSCPEISTHRMINDTTIIKFQSLLANIDWSVMLQLVMPVNPAPSAPAS